MGVPPGQANLSGPPWPAAEAAGQALVARAATMASAIGALEAGF